MTRHMAVVVLAVLATVSTFAQTPAGWKQRLDRSTSASDPDAKGEVQFVKQGAGFHATNPTAAVFWNPANTATGSYTIKATFTLLKPSSHANYYGLVFGGSDLEGPKQAYLYFTVAQNGTWLIKQRDGDASSPTITARTPSDVVKKPGADGTSVNMLEVRVLADKVDFVVNGTVVTSMPRTGQLAKTDGIYGVRINHQLDVQIDGLEVSKK